jgi:hypothetical protein
LLIVACFGNLADNLVAFGVMPYADTVSSVASVLMCGELPMILWLLIVGAKDQPLPATA